MWNLKNIKQLMMSDVRCEMTITRLVCVALLATQNLIAAACGEITAFCLWFCASTVFKSTRQMANGGWASYRCFIGPTWLWSMVISVGSESVPRPVCSVLCL